MTRAAPILAAMAALALLALGAKAQTIDQLAPKAGDGAVDQLAPANGQAAPDVGQISAPNGDDAARIEEIGPGDVDVSVEQPQGRDLCDPSVSEAQRRAAGVDCTRKVVRGAPPPRTGTAEDPLLTPRDQEMREGFQSLDLGDDVPPTVILQR